MSKTKIGVLDCNISVLNTGIVDCAPDPKNFVGAIHIPTGKTWTATEIETFKTALADLINEDNVANRIFPVKTFTAMNDKGEEAQYRTSGYGTKSKGRNGKYGWEFNYEKGAYELHRSLSSFDNKQDSYDVLFIDQANNCLWGVRAGDQNNEFGGISLELIDVLNFKLNNGTDDTVYGICYYLADSDEINTQLIPIKFEPTYKVAKRLSGLKNITPIVDTAITGGLLKLQLMSGGTDLKDVFATELGTAGVAAYSAVNYSTGGAIAVSSVAYVAGTGTFNVQLDTLDPNYPATSGELITVSIGPVSALITAGVLGYGNCSLTVPRD